MTTTLGLATALCWLATGAVLEQTYDGSAWPNEMRPAWSFAPRPGTTAELVDGVLRLVDQGTANGELNFISFPWSADPDRPHSVTAKVKVVACSGPSGVAILAANGRLEAGLTLYPDRIEIHREAIQAPVRLDDDFHEITVQLQGQDLVVLVDGREVIDHRGRWSHPAHQGRNLVGFGSISSPATGEAWWARVGFRLELPEAPTWPGAEHVTVYYQPDVYACFPSLYQMPDGSLVTNFGTRTRRSHIDGTGGTARRVSRDGGLTWSEAPPGFPYYNPETVRADGNLAVAGAIGWTNVGADQRERLEAEGRTVMAVRDGVVAYLSGARSAVRSRDGQVVRDWVPIQTPPTRGFMGYNQAAVLNLGDGVHLVAIYDTGPDGYRSAYVLRSEDDGETWECLPLALGDTRLSFNETALIANAEGHVIAHLRTFESPDKEVAGELYQAVSTDRGRTWSAPRATGIWGYPAHLLRLPDGRLISTYGYRRPPMGVRACLSRDGGVTWDVANEIVLRADGFYNGSDLGYPLTTRLADGTLVTSYYHNGLDNVTHVAVTRWQPPAE